jgi:hypothetical protein
LKSGQAYESISQRWWKALFREVDLIGQHEFETGHKSAAVHRGYTHHEIEVLREATKKIPGI